MRLPLLILTLAIWLAPPVVQLNQAYPYNGSTAGLRIEQMPGLTITQLGD